MSGVIEFEGGYLQSRASTVSNGALIDEVKDK